MSVGDLDYSFRDQSLKEYLILGTVLAVSPLLRFPFIYYIGYLTSVMGKTIEGDNTTPRIAADTIKEQIINGIAATFVSIIYFIPNIIYALIFFISFGVGAYGAGPPNPSTVRMIHAGLIGSVLGLSLQLIIMIVFMPVSLSIIADKDKKLEAIKESLSPRKLYTIAKSKKYLYHLFKGLLTFICSSIVVILIMYFLWLSIPIFFSGTFTATELIFKAVENAIFYTGILVISSVLILSTNIIAKGIAPK